jgi:hypothetical protein
VGELGQCSNAKLTIDAGSEDIAGTILSGVLDSFPACTIATPIVATLGKRKHGYGRNSHTMKMETKSARADQMLRWAYSVTRFKNR